MRSVVANLAVVSGVASAVYGCWLIAPYVAWIVGGVASCAVGVLVAKPTNGVDKE